jgi:hypothetical protein
MSEKNITLTAKLGEDPILLATRAMLLSDWETVIANSSKLPR